MTQSEVKELFDYNTDTGVFIWKVSRSNSVKIGDIAGTITEHGYRAINLRGKIYYAHRLAWLYTFGCWPKGKMDHKNGVRSDNRINNIREANDLQNSANKKKIRSGLKGCYWNQDRQKWQAGISINNKTKNLGRFATEQEAHDAYFTAAQQLYGAFARAA